MAELLSDKSQPPLRDDEWESGTGRSELSVAFVCAGDALDVRTWSGTPLHMVRALQMSCDVRHIVRQPWQRWFSPARKLLLKVTAGRIDIYWISWITRIAAHRTKRELEKGDFDVVVVVAATPLAVALAEGGASVVYISDATVASMQNYNGRFRRLWPWLKRAAFKMETVALRQSLISCFPSDWARSSAVADHDAPPTRTYQIPWGANFSADLHPSQIKEVRHPWRLLFVGVNWIGKGGDIAVATLEHLREMGCEATLDVVGSAPAGHPQPIEGVTFRGFISKSTSAGQKALSELFEQAHLLILPTQFDAFPTVIAESASFAVPAISYRTGGLPSNVHDGKTGLLLDRGASPEDFAKEIAALLSDHERYKEMSKEALSFSVGHLNWTSWATGVVSAVRAALVRP